MAIQTARWVHGTEFNVEYPDRLVRQERKGWGSEFFMKPSTDNWFHVSIPTPVIIDGSRPLLSNIIILYRIGVVLGGPSITSIHLYDGYHKIMEYKGNYSGDHHKALDAMNKWTLDSPLQIQSGLGISVQARCSESFGDSGGHKVIFASAGADFIKG